MPILSELRKAVAADDRSQSSIAKKARIHPKTFSAFMNERRGLSIESAERLAKAMRFSIKLIRAKSAHNLR